MKKKIALLAVLAVIAAAVYALLKRVEVRLITLDDEEDDDETTAEPGPEHRAARAADPGDGFRPGPGVGVLND